MASSADAGNFEASLGCLFSSGLERLAAQLDSAADLDPAECGIILNATRQSLLSALHSKLSRLLVLELNAARVTGRLTGDDERLRWLQFLEMSSQPDFWSGLCEHYPTLLARISRIVENRCAASLSFARNFAADRQALAQIGFYGKLEKLHFGAGDSHCRGLTVALLTGTCGGRVVYKPRPMSIDATLRRFVDLVCDELGLASSIRVPEVIERGAYGWAAYVAHRHASKEELPRFYRGIGHWLAIMRLLGGSDLHAENVIAHEDSPVVVDCEALFAPNLPLPSSGLGQGPDHAAELLSRSVLSVGLLPGRGMGLGWRGVDSSALGMLPGQQPRLPTLGIVNAGSDEARIGTTLIEVAASQNHPSPRPVLSEYWPTVLDGFEEMTQGLRSLDARNLLSGWLQDFTDCRIRVVTRATEVYAEIGRMLWHPVSLHDHESARERARDLMKRMAGNVPLAPSEPAVIEAEIDDLMDGDIPYFSTIVRIGRLQGPRGTHWLPNRDLLQAALDDWRDMDHALDRKIIQVSLISAYLNDGWTPNQKSLRPSVIRHGDADARRRRQASRIMRMIMEHAIHGDDGTIVWIAPVLNPTGWSVQPLDTDLYNGLSGIALLAGAYLCESAAGRVDAVPGVEDLLEALLRTLSLSETKLEGQLRQKARIRPPQLGGYIGLGSQILTHVILSDWGLGGGNGLSRARRLAELIPELIAGDEVHDVLGGAAGAIVPLLLLAERCNDPGYVATATSLGERLCATANSKGDSVYWGGKQWPQGVGGFAHGVTGTGWALARLARATGSAKYRNLAEQAFRFEAELFDPVEQGWLDLRNDSPEIPREARFTAAWCHGAVGIGLARLDLDPSMQNPETRQILHTAAALTWRKGFGWNHTACHGDLGAWELLDHALRANEAPEDLSPEALMDFILTGIEDHGPCSGFVRDALAPGLLPGIGGIAYQLLRMHPDSPLPSILIPGSAR